MIQFQFVLMHMPTVHYRYTLDPSNSTMAEVAPLLDIMWGGVVFVGPKVAQACCLEAAPYAMAHRPPELRPAWEAAMAKAHELFPPELYGEKFAVTIVEYVDGTVKPITSKNYHEMLRRTDIAALDAAIASTAAAEAAAAAAAATNQDATGGEGGDTNNNGEDGALSG